MNELGWWNLISIAGWLAALALALLMRRDLRRATHANEAAQEAWRKVSTEGRGKPTRPLDALFDPPRTSAPVPPPPNTASRDRDNSPTKTGSLVEFIDTLNGRPDRKLFPSRVKVNGVDLGRLDVNPSIKLAHMSSLGVNLTLLPSQLVFRRAHPGEYPQLEQAS